MKTFFQFFEESMYNGVYSMSDYSSFKPEDYNLPSDVNEIIGRGASSIVVSNPSHDKVYKIPHFAKNKNAKEILKRRKEEVNAIKKLESIGYIKYPILIMHYGTFLHFKNHYGYKAAKTKVLKRIKDLNIEKYYYDKKYKGFVGEKFWKISPTNIEILDNGIIIQDKINGRHVTKNEFTQISKALKNKGFFVDTLGNIGNFKVIDDKLFIIDGVR